MAAKFRRVILTLSNAKGKDLCTFPAARTLSAIKFFSAHSVAFLSVLYDCAFPPTWNDKSQLFHVPPADLDHRLRCT